MWFRWDGVDGGTQCPPPTERASLITHTQPNNQNRRSSTPPRSATPRSTRPPPSVRACLHVARSVWCLSSLLAGRPPEAMKGTISHEPQPTSFFPNTTHKHRADHLLHRGLYGHPLPGAPHLHRRCVLFLFCLSCSWPGPSVGCFNGTADLPTYPFIPRKTAQHRQVLHRAVQPHLRYLWRCLRTYVAYFRM